MRSSIKYSFSIVCSMTTILPSAVHKRVCRYSESPCQVSEKPPDQDIDNSSRTINGVCTKNGRINNIETAMSTANQNWQSQWLKTLFMIFMVKIDSSDKICKNQRTAK